MGPSLTGSHPDRAENGVPAPGAGPDRFARSVMPLLTAATGAAALAGPGFARRLTKRGVPERVSTLAVGALLVSSGWATLAVLERVRPLRADWSRPDDDLSADLLHLALGITVVGQVSRATASALVAPVSPRLAQAAGGRLWPDRWPLVARAGLALVVSEFAHYWHHRLSHTTEPMWRFHEIHHSPNRLTWLNATRFHPLDLGPMIALQDLSLMLLGVDAESLLAYSIFRGVHGQIQHANIDGRGGKLNLVFSSVDQHRYHHSVDRRERNHNYGAVLSVWDRVFGTLLIEPDETVFTDRVGLGRDDYPRTWTGQWRRPFRRRRG